MVHKNPRAAVYTLGCRVNQYESDAVEEELISLGFEVRPFTELCDVYIINTCAVTAESERKSRQIIRRASAANPEAYILVMIALHSGQTLLLHDVNASEICFLGFSEFGTIRDTYTIGYQQFEKEFDFVFKTLHTHGWQGIESEQNNRCIPVLQTFGSDGQKHRLYVWRQILDKTQKINKIVLPVNLSIHIVAMSFGL